MTGYKLINIVGYPNFAEYVVQNGIDPATYPLGDGTLYTNINWSSLAGLPLLIGFDVMNIDYINGKYRERMVNYLYTGYSTLYNNTTFDISELNTFLTNNPSITVIRNASSLPIPP